MSNRSACEAAVRQLWPFLDGVVDESAREAVVAHLEVCAKCASHFEFAREFLDAVARTASNLPLSDELRGRVLAALAAEGFSRTA